MAHPWNHAIASARAFGSTPEIHFPLHHFIDHSKMILADPRHRSLLHHEVGITITEIAFAHIPQAREITSQHIIEDMGQIPKLSDWIAEPSQSLTKSVLRNHLAQSPNLLACIENHRFPHADQEGLEQIIQILSLPETLEPKLANSPLRLFYFTAAGIFLCENVIGTLLPNSQTPTRYAAEWVVRNTLKNIPTFQDILQEVDIEPWMYQNAKKII